MSNAFVPKFRFPFAVILTVGYGLGCGGGSEFGVPGTNDGAAGATNGSLPDNDLPDDADREEDLFGENEPEGEEEETLDDGAEEDADDEADGSNVQSSTDCAAALPAGAVRFSGNVKSSRDGNCNVWALSIAPTGPGHTFTLARAERDAQNPLLTTDSTVVLQGAVLGRECMYNAAPLFRTAVFDGAGLGPSPFLETRFTAEFTHVLSEPSLQIAIETHGAAGALTCEGSLQFELP